MIRFVTTLLAALAATLGAANAQSDLVKRGAISVQSGPLAHGQARSGTVTALSAASWMER